MKSKQELWDAIIKFEVNAIHQACQTLGHSCNWEYFDDELKTYCVDDMQRLLKELKEQEFEE